MSVEKEWWKAACEDNPHAIAFIGTDDKFIYVNNAWCQLCGWSSAQLMGKMRWQDITTDEDIGGDQNNTEDIKDGDKVEYYLEKEYISPTGAKKAVGLYVKRYPPFGPQKGYLVFGIPLNTREYESLRQAYIELRNNIILVEKQQHGFNQCFSRLDLLEQEQRTMTQKIDAFLITQANSPKFSTNTYAGNSSETVGGNQNINNGWVIVAIVMSAVMLGVLAIGGAVTYKLMNGQEIKVESTEK